MAKNCTYTYRGKQYSESELKNLLLAGELSKLVNNEDINGDAYSFLVTPKPVTKVEEIQRTVTNKKEMVEALQSVFNLPKNQAEAVAKVYDAAAQGMVNLGIYSSKEEYYKNTPLFVKPSSSEELKADKDILFSTMKEGLDDLEFVDLMEFEDDPYRMAFDVKRGNEEIGVVEINRNKFGEFYVSWVKRTGGEQGDGARIIQRAMQNLINKGLPVTVDSYITSAGYAAMSKLVESGFLIKLRDEIIEPNSRSLKPVFYDTPAFKINPEIAVPNNQKILFQQSPSQAVSFVQKGFDLVPTTRGFGNSFTTKTGKATPELAKRINDWLQSNGYNNVRFNYEKTYGTLVPFMRQTPQQGLLFQIIGEKGANRYNNFTISSNLIVAKNMEKAKKTPKEIYLATGWEKNINNKWQYDLNDETFNVKFTLSDIEKNKNKVIPISEIYDISELSKIYPNIKKLKVIFMDDLKENMLSFKPLAGYSNYNLIKDIPLDEVELEEFKIAKLNKSSIISISLDSFNNKLNNENAENLLKRIFTHELQHFIQDEEGYFYTRNGLAATYDLLSDLYLTDINDIYKKISNEVEARNSEKRLTVPYYERQKLMISDTEDVERKDQYYFEDSKSSYYDSYLNQQAKGAIDLNKRIIYALTSPDVSTPLHEFAHLWLSDIEKAALSGNKQAAALLDTFDSFANSDEAKKFHKKNFGTKEFNSSDNVFRQELFARGFERYIADGQAPKSVLEQIFEMFKQWLKDIYNGITGSEIDIELNEQMTQIYDQILGKKVKSKKQAVSKAPVITPAAEQPVEFSWDKLSEQPLNVLQERLQNVETDLISADRVEAEELNAKKSALERIIGEKLKQNPDKTAVEEKEVQNEIVQQEQQIQPEPIKTINKVQVDFENQRTISKKEAAVQSTKQLIPFENNNKELSGIKTGMFVEFKGKEYVVSNIDDDGFLTLVSKDITQEKGNTIFYTRTPSKADLNIALPQMVKPIIKETIEDRKKADPAIRIAERISQMFPQIKFEIGNYSWKQAGKFENGVVKLNKKYVTPDTPIHEFLHPFILALKINNNQLYRNLVSELRNPEYRSIIEEIKNDSTYDNSSSDDKIDEALVRIISRDIVEVFDDEGNIDEEKLEQKRKSLTDVIAELFKYILDLIFGRTKNTNLKVFINKMNSDLLLSKFNFKIVDLNDTRSQIDTLELTNKTVILINPKYFTDLTIVENLFSELQENLSEQDYNLLINRAKQNIQLTGKEKSTNKVREIKYKKSTKQLIVKKFSENTRKLQSAKTVEIDSFDEIAQYVSPEEYSYIVEQLNMLNDSENDVITITDIDSSVIYTKANDYIKNLSVKDIPINLTLRDLADFIITQNVKFEYNQGEMEAIGQLVAFSSNAKKAAPASEEVKKAVAKLRDRVRNLKDVGDRRILNDSGKTSPLTQQANALEDVLRNQNDAEALIEYIREGIVSLEFAVQKMNMLRNDFYEKINSDNITTDEVNEFNRRFKEISTYYSYFSDISYLANRFEDLFFDIQPKSSAKEELSRINTVLGKVELSKKNFQGLVRDMVTEWLFPHYYAQMELVAERNKNLPKVIEKKIEGKGYIKYGDGKFEIDKEGLKKHLRNQLISAEQDASLETYLLGSTITSRDPVNAITSMVVTDAIYENDEYADRLWVTLNYQYNKFLKDKGLPDSQKELRQWYKDNYLRKAQVWEKIGWDEVKKEPIYGYVERLAYHEDKFYDLIEKDLKEYIKTLPVANTAEEYNENRKKIYDKREELLKDSKYINPKYDQLSKDDYYMLLYKNYQFSNSYFGNNSLKFGIIGQVSAKKTPTQAIKETAENIKEKVGEISKEDTVRKKVKNVVNSTAEYLFDDNDPIDNVEYNFDESLYRNVRTSTLVPINNEEDLELLLHENVMVFTKDALKYNSFRNIQANVDNLKYLIQGNPSLGINPRKVLNLNKKGELKWYNFIKLPKRKEDYQNRLNDQLVKQINDIFYGEDEEQHFVNIGGKTVSLNNIGKNLGFATAMLNMSGNLLAMTRNLTIGNVTNLMEAVGSRYVSLSDYKSAVAEYTKEMFNPQSGIVADLFSPNKSKIAQMALLYDAIQGEYRDRTGRIITDNFTRRFYSKNSWFVMNHAAEHQIQLTMMIALMKGKKVKTKDGQTISLWDAYQIGDNNVYSLSNNVNWTDQDTSSFRKEMHSVLRELNGNYSEFHKAVLQRSWWGKLMLIYRKYIYPQVRSRFGGFRVDYERGDVAYGYYRLFFKQLLDDVRSEGVAQAFANIKANLSNNEEKTYLNYATRKTTFELMTLIGLLILIKAAAPDDDEEISKTNAYALWWLNSLYSDLGSYTFQSLPEISRQVKNPSAGNITLTKAAGLADQLLSDIMSGELERYETSGYGFEKGDTKLGSKFEKLVPIVNQVNRAMNPEQQLQFFSLIGKRVRTE